MSDQRLQIMHSDRWRVHEKEGGYVVERLVTNIERHQMRVFSSRAFARAHCDALNGIAVPDSQLSTLNSQLSSR